MSSADAPFDPAAVRPAPLIRSPDLRANAPGDAASVDLAWRVVALANLYRLLLPPVLFAVYMFTRPTPSVGGTNPQVFLLLCLVYWVLGGLFAFGGRGHWPSRRVLVLTHTLADSAAVAVLL